MTGLHETHLRVVSLRWTMDPNQQAPIQISVPQVLQVDNLQDPSRIAIVNHTGTFDRMVIPYVINFSEATGGGLVFRRPRLVPRYVPFNGQSDVFYDVSDWPVPDLYVWQATDDLLHFGRAADGIDVTLSPRPWDDVDLALSVTFQPVDYNYYTVVVNSIVLVPAAG